MKKIAKIFSWIFISIFLLLGGLMIFTALPISGNYDFFTVQSGSMEPTIKTGSLIFTRSVGDYQVGDIITRKMENSKSTVTHRIARREDDKFFTKGDANDDEDQGEVLMENIVGKVYLTIPYLGYPVSFSKTPQGFILIIVIPAVILVYEELRKIKDEIKKKIDYRKRIKARQENVEDKNEEKNEDL